MNEKVIFVSRIKPRILEGSSTQFNLYKTKILGKSGLKEIQFAVNVKDKEMVKKVRQGNEIPLKFLLDSQIRI